MNLGQNATGDYKLKLRITGMKHYKCLAFERFRSVYKNWFFLSKKLCLELQTFAP